MSSLSDYCDENNKNGRSQADINCKLVTLKDRDALKNVNINATGYLYFFQMRLYSQTFFCLDAIHLLGKQGSVNTHCQNFVFNNEFIKSSLTP